MDERMQKQLAFALEIDKEKNVLRQTHLSGHGGDRLCPPPEDAARLREAF